MSDAELHVTKVSFVLATSANNARAHFIRPEKIKGLVEEMLPASGFLREVAAQAGFAPGDIVHVIVEFELSNGERYSADYEDKAKLRKLFSPNTTLELGALLRGLLPPGAEDGRERIHLTGFARPDGVASYV